MKTPEVVTFPGFVDVHVHFREPSTNKSETISSGSYAAMLGGYALVADMPNNPGHPTWSEDRLLEKHEIAKEYSYIPMAFYAGAQPESDNIGELEAMSKLAVGIKFYADPTTGNEKMYEPKDFMPAAEEWHRVAPNKPILLHATNIDVMTELVLRIGDQLGHKVHVCHVNDPAQAKLVETAKVAGKDRLPVTCGVCPHHLLKDSHDEKTEGEFAKMVPPLAHQLDAEKLMWQLNQGHIDIIESDHAPHSKDDKWKAELGEGHCYGVPGIEQLVPLMLYQVKNGSLGVDRFMDAVSVQPARLLNIKIAHNTHSTWELTEERLDSEENIASGAGWSTYTGMLTGGKLLESVIGGRRVIGRRHEFRLPHKVVAKINEEV